MSSFGFETTGFSATALAYGISGYDATLALALGPEVQDLESGDSAGFWRT